MKPRPQYRIDEATRESWKMAIMWHFTSHLPRLRSLDRPAVLAVGEAVSELSSRVPLHLEPGPHAVPGWPEAVSGAEATALLLACIWVAAGESEHVCGALLQHWPELPLFASLASDGFPVEAIHG